MNSVACTSTEFQASAIELSLPLVFQEGAPYQIRSHILTNDLSAEIVAFCRFLAPTADEREARDDAIARVTAMVKDIWAGADVLVFGSYATGVRICK